MKRSSTAAERSAIESLKKLCLPPSASLRRGLEVIDRGSLNLAFVTLRGRVVGTLSDGDARRVILKGLELDRPGGVGEAMQPNFTWVGEDVSRAEVLDLMRARYISQVPVLDAGHRLIGLHSLRDLIGARLRDNRAVIMAGGAGIRLRPDTKTVPKPMLKIAGRPILERLVLHLMAFGLREFFIATNYLGEVIEDHFGDGSALGCNIHYLREKRPLGTGGALSLLPPSRTRAGRAPVLVINGDLVTDARVDEILDRHERSSHVATVCLRPHVSESPFGVAEVEGDRLVRLEEKPATRSLVNAGIYVLAPKAIRMVPARTEYPITRLLEACLDRGLSVGAHVLEGSWADVGSHEELKVARGQV